MRLALITSRYAPESSPGAKRASDLITSLRSLGHRVTVLTQLPSCPDPAASVDGAAAGSRAVIEAGEAGNATWRFPPKVVSRGNLLGRLAAEARFAALASRRRTRISDLDGVIASTPFVFNLLAARSYRVPMWLDVRDLTWEYTRDLGPRSLVKGIGAAALRRLALRSLHAAKGVSTTTDGQRRYLIERGIPSHKVRVVPNGVPKSVIEDLARRGATASVGPGASLKVVYAGLLGFPQGLSFAVETFAKMGPTVAGRDLEFHIYGEGVDRQPLVEYCRGRDLRHVRIHDQVPYDDYLQVIASADILLASLRPEVQTAMPSKVLEYMAAGKPVLFIGSGDGAETVAQAGAGVAVPHGDSERLRDALVELARDAKLRADLGENGRSWVTRHRVREEVNRAWVRMIEETFEECGRARWKATGRGASGRRAHEGRIRRALVKPASLAAWGAEMCGLLRLLERTSDGREDRLRALVYHRILEPGALPGACPGLVSATTAEFARQMEFLARSYRLVSIEEVLDAVRLGRSIPPRAVLVSFDDAYRDFAENAWPIMKRHRIPVTLFVPTAFPGQPDRVFWWDRLHESIRSTGATRADTPFGPIRLTTPGERLESFRWLRERIKETSHHEAMKSVDRICQGLGGDLPASLVLDWDALRCLVKEGVALAAHTRTHPVIDRIPVEEVRAEVAGSLEDLWRETGSRLPVFAYPSGRYDDQSLRAVAETGIKIAFTTVGGVNDLRRSDPLRLRRIHVGPRVTRPVLRTQLLGVRAPAWLRR